MDGNSSNRIIYSYFIKENYTIYDQASSYKTYNRRFPDRHLVSTCCNTYQASKDTVQDHCDIISFKLQKREQQGSKRTRSTCNGSCNKYPGNVTRRSA